MGTNIPKISNINDIDLSAAREKITSGVSGFCISIFTDQDQILGELDKAEKAGKKAKSKISDTNSELDKTRSKVGEAENKQSDAKSKETDAKSKESEMSNNDLGSMSGNTSNISSQSKASAQKLTESDSQLTSKTNTATTKGQESGAKLDATNAQMQELTASSQAAMDEISSLQNDDGTGSGVHSALTLKTGAEIQEMEENGTSNGDDNSAKIQEKMQVVQSNDAKMQALSSDAQAEASRAEAQADEADAIAASLQAEAQSQEQTAKEQDSSLNEISGVSKQITAIANVVDLTGTTLNAVGLGVQAAGIATTTAGTGVGVTGGILSGIGVTLSAIGIPLIPVFGAGVPVEAAGVTTGAGGATTAGTGATVATTGSTITGVGTTLKTTGNTMATAAKGVKTATSALDIAVNVAKGDVTGVLTAVAKTVANGATTMGSMGSLKALNNTKLESVMNFANQHKTVLNNTTNLGNAFKDGTNAVKKAVNGDFAGAASDGFSALSCATGVGNGKIMANTSDVLNGVSGAVSMGKDISSGNVDGFDITMDALSTVASFDATRRRGSDSDVSVFSKGSDGEVKGSFRRSDKTSNLYKTTSKIKNVHSELMKSDDISFTSGNNIDPSDAQLQSKKGKMKQRKA